jgi:hypothetical protein
MNERDDTVPAVAYECPCGWWHVGRDKVFGTAICGWCGVEFRYLRRDPQGHPAALVQAYACQERQATQARPPP